MFEEFRQRVPDVLKRRVRKMVDAVDAAAQNRALERCVSALRSRRQSGSVDLDLLNEIRRAWGNEAYSADAGYLAQMAARVLESPGPFLECGSGVSTLIAGLLASAGRGRIWSLEQDPVWHEQITATLQRFDIANVEVVYAPLREYEDFAWFSVPDRGLPSEFTHVFCDGPAISESKWADPFYSNWRVGVVPVLREQGIRFGEILLDDADDPRAMPLCRRWESCGLVASASQTSTGPYVSFRPRWEK